MSVTSALAVRHFARHTCRLSVVWAALAAISLGSKASFAAPPSNLEVQIKAHLAAGEFGPAQALAKTAKPAERNLFLRDIAVAQAAAGARGASLSTAVSISNSQVQGQTYNAIGQQPAGRGGAAAADFDSLIELITTTIAPTTWEDAGGAGAIAEFRGGVYVEPSGLLKKMTIDGSRTLAAVHKKASVSAGVTDVRDKSALRKVSLVRLEQQIHALRALGRGPDEAMTTLAGLQSIKYVLVYPDSGDIVLAGPAGDWKLNDEERLVSVDTGRPVVLLDDFVVVLRNAYSPAGTFGCSINPTTDHLAKTKAFLEASAKTPLKPGAAARDKWLRELRDTLGQQDIVVYGIDPRTRAARILVEADYRMKLVGMGLEDGVLGVTSYLNSIKVGKDGGVPPMDVLRWWFTMNYDAVSATEAHNAFEFKGQGVRVLSENELLTARGERVHTGKSDDLNSEFAHSFTKHFAELSAKYPIYAELKNIFDLALVAALLKSQDLPNQVGWQMGYFNPGPKSESPAYEVELGYAPDKVETVINHRIVNGKQIVAGISGGVTAEPRKLISTGVKTDTYGLMKAEHAGAAPKNLPKNAWWWD